MFLKRPISSLAAVAIISSFLLVPVTPVQAFSDISNSDFREAIEKLKEDGVIEGYADGTFQPLSKINRAEFLKIIYEGAKGAKVTEGADEYRDCFPDVTDQWFAKYVCLAKEEGIIAGYADGTFQPGKEINFAEAAKILSLAYEQDVQQADGPWYEGYVKALESSRSIPQTVARLDADLNRGEMAEMMWRIAEGKTDQPSKGMLNLERPEFSINTASDAVQYASSCEEIQLLMEDVQPRSMYFYAEDNALDSMPSAPTLMRNEVMEASPASGSAAQDKSFSDTNVQVEGVDEADIVKTDGSYVYYFNRQKSFVSIVRVSDLIEVSRISTNNEEGFNVQDLYLADGRLILLGNRWHTYSRPVPEPMPMERSMIAPYPGPSRSQTAVRIYNIVDASKPKLVREVSIDGNMVSSRRIGEKLYLVTNQSFPYHILRGTDDLREEEILPLYTDTAKNIEDEPMVRCPDIGIIPGISRPQYVVVSVVPLENESADVKSEVILGSADNVYMSLENLYLADVQHEYHWRVGGESTEKTRIYRFKVESGGVSFKAQGTVPGRILNQFSMDEHEDHFRIATTKGNMWNEENLSTNNLYVLNQSLEVTGTIEGIAPGEKIYSVRFMGDRAYMVTFKNTDPFFVIDVSDPRNPNILGKLKIPGYSDYLHPYDANTIIGFGKEAVEALSDEGWGGSDFAWYQGMKVAMFDVTDVSDPKELHKITIGDRGTDSPLLHNHKALLFEKDRSLMAFPIRVLQIPDEKKTGRTGSMYGDPVFQGAYVFDVSKRNGFRIRGTITHYPEDQWKKAGDRYYGYGQDVERIIRIGSDLLTVSPWGIKKNDEQTVGETGVFLFDEKPQQSSCSGEDDEGVRYISKDVKTCATINFSCAEDEEAFNDECGCGCK